MSLYGMICEINLNMLRGSEFTDGYKAKAVKRLLSAVSGSETVERFHSGVNKNSAGSLSRDTKQSHMYPMFYITPYNDGKKTKLVTGELPKTHILAANHYELEILRILALWGGGAAADMIQRTHERLEKTCFAHFCAAGECAGAGLCAVRLWTAAGTSGDGRVIKIMEPMFKRFEGGRGSAYYAKANLPVYYLFAAAAAVAESDALPEAKKFCLDFIRRNKPWIEERVGHEGSQREICTAPPEYEYVSNEFVFAETQFADGCGDHKAMRRHALLNALAVLTE